MSFSHSLFSCCQDLKTTLVTCFVPCVTEGEIAKELGKDCLIWGALYCFAGCIIGGLNRNELRKKKNIHGNIVQDFLIHCCCPCCALIQERREFSGSRTVDVRIDR
ncbi:Cell number regulator 1 [Thelohanellus kitauei]|uniref:Cell number regulator 1 n=1 Tax=Thelohanellus kitauei TaxID=669202 RepID=A0A0C2NA48_THEKT|nr:Cell number regulator 1 [Thelohanellus kitauei]